MFKIDNKFNRLEHRHLFTPTWKGARVGMNLTPESYATAFGHAKGERYPVTDADTGITYVVTRAACGLGCYCDARIVKVQK